MLMHLFVLCGAALLVSPTPLPAPVVSCLPAVLLSACHRCARHFPVATALYQLGPKHVNRPVALALSDNLPQSHPTSPCNVDAIVCFVGGRVASFSPAAAGSSSFREVS